VRASLILVVLALGCAPVEGRVHGLDSGGEAVDDDTGEVEPAGMSLELSARFAVVSSGRMCFQEVDVPGGGTVHVGPSVEVELFDADGEELCTIGYSLLQPTSVFYETWEQVHERQDGTSVTLEHTAVGLALGDGMHLGHRSCWGVILDDGEAWSVEEIDAWLRASDLVLMATPWVDEDGRAIRRSRIHLDGQARLGEPVSLYSIDEVCRPVLDDRGEPVELPGSQVLQAGGIVRGAYEVRSARMPLRDLR